MFKLLEFITMNKSPIILSLVSVLAVACSSKNSVEETGTQLSVVEKVSITSKTKRQKRHHKLPEGVISADIYNDNGRLHLLQGKHTQGKKTLWYQFSDDHGKNWSKAVKILNADNLPANMQRGKDAQITALGNTVLVTWMEHVEGARFNAGPMLAVRSEDGGKTWSYTSTPPDWKKGPHGYTDLSSDSVAMHAVWLDSRLGPSGIKATQALYYARSIDGGISWQSNITLDKMTCSCCWNTVKADNKGNAYVLYRDKQPSDLALAVVGRQQKTQRLSHVGAFNWQFEGCPHIGGGLDFQQKWGTDRIHAVVGTGHTEHLGVHYLYSDDGGLNWSDTIALGDESALHGDVAAHDNGRVVAVWDMMSDSGLGIFTAESLDHGKNWSATRQLSAQGGRASHPRIVKTKNGFLTIWTESDGVQQSLKALVL